MTVTYSANIGTATSTAIVKLFVCWKGSLWKTVLPELSIWMLLYATLSVIYRTALSDAQQIIFERVCVLFYTFSEYIPLNFILGFYVTSVYGRWNNYVNNIGWIDTPCLFVASYVHGTDDEARLIRRNIIRYLMVVQAMVFRRVSIRVKKRFPTDEHLVTAGLMTKEELKLFNDIKSPHSKFWVAAEWAFNLVRIAREKNLIKSDIIYTQLMDKLAIFRTSVLNLFIFDWIPIPLVYTQCVSAAVRIYFLFALLGRQYLLHDQGTPHSRNIDLYIPILTICQFIFYVGWMKAAEVMLNPMGEDDEDLELNYLLDRNLDVGLMVVDKCYSMLPPQEKDKFWEDKNAEPLYTRKASRVPQNPMLGSCETPPDKKKDLRNTQQQTMVKKEKISMAKKVSNKKPFYKRFYSLRNSRRKIIPIQTVLDKNPPNLVINGIQKDADNKGNIVDQNGNLYIAEKSMINGQLKHAIVDLQGTENEGKEENKEHYLKIPIA